MADSFFNPHLADSFPFDFAQGFRLTGSTSFRLVPFGKLRTFRLTAAVDAASANDMYRRGAYPGEGRRGYAATMRKALRSACDNSS